MTGLYTEIVEIIAPSSAAIGSIVNVQVNIRNITSTAFRIYCSAAFTGPVNSIRFIDFVSLIVEPGQLVGFANPFTMPSNEVTIYAASWYEGAPNELHFDDAKEKVVSLAESVPGFSELVIIGFSKV